MSRKIGPMLADNLAIGKPCPGCQEPYKEGDYTCLIPLGPGKEESERKKRNEGKSYNAIAIQIHYDCADNAYRDPRLKEVVTPKKKIIL